MEDRDDRQKSVEGKARVASHDLAARQQGELAIRTMVAAGEIATAASDAAHLYGAEVFGFLFAVLDGGTATRDVYASIVQRVARELAAFDWRTTLRTWMYARARRELARHREKHVSQPAGDSLQPVALPTAVEQRRVGPPAALAALRRALDPEDREILILRIDRRLGWWDLAITSLDDGATFGELMVESRRLRGRVDEIRARVLRAAVDRRLMDPR